MPKCPHSVTYIKGPWFKNGGGKQSDQGYPEIQQANDKLSHIRICSSGIRTLLVRIKSIRIKYK